MDPATYDSAAFAREFAVPRETLARLTAYEAALRATQMHTNLVAPSTLADLWNRHMRDSAQLVRLAGPRAHRRIWLDIGAGGGFPGLVLAAMTDDVVHQVESVGKKARFLKEAGAAMGLGDRHVVHNARIEAMAAFPADLITARACAALDQLFDWGLRFAARSTRWLLLKGATVETEVGAARRRFDFEAELVQSVSDPRGRILLAADVRRRGVRA